MWNCVGQTCNLLWEVDKMMQLWCSKFVPNGFSGSWIDCKQSFDFWRTPWVQNCEFSSFSHDFPSGKHNYAYITSQQSCLQLPRHMEQYIVSPESSTLFLYWLKHAFGQWCHGCHTARNQPMLTFVMWSHCSFFLSFMSSAVLCPFLLAGCSMLSLWTSCSLCGLRLSFYVPPSAQFWNLSRKCAIAKATMALGAISPCKAV